MPIDSYSLAKELNELRALAAKKLVLDPLPIGKEATARLQAKIEEHELQANIAEFETQGYTVLPPGKAAPLEFVDRLRETILRLAADDRSAENFAGQDRGLGQTAFHLLPRDLIFEEALMAPAPGTIVTYLLGHRAKLS